MDNVIPIQNLSELSQNLQDKYELLSSKFEKNFGQRPEFFARAPGRVNLIGNFTLFFYHIF